MDDLAKLQNKNAHQLAMEVIRNYVAAQQNGRNEWFGKRDHLNFVALEVDVKRVNECNSVLILSLGLLLFCNSWNEWMLLDLV